MNSGLVTVLVIEDDHDTRVSLREVLEQAHYRVLSATNGRDGLELLGKLSGRSVVILDWMLPLMNGDEFMRAKQADEKLSKIPVIVVSAHARASQAVGKQAFIPKPIDQTDLLSAVKRLAG